MLCAFRTGGKKWTHDVLNKPPTQRDLATHLGHWAGGAEDGRYAEPPLAFPSETEQRSFLNAYADAASLGGAAAVEGLLNEVAMVRPLVHATWGAWAVCSLAGALAKPPTKFSHFEYAERHFMGLNRQMIAAAQLRP